MFKWLLGNDEEVATVHHPSLESDEQATVTIRGRHHENVTEASMERLYIATNQTYGNWQDNEDGSQDQPLSKRRWFW